MPVPNFLIIGTAKGGTTSLYYYLNQHPQIYMSRLKEPRFFALEGVKLDFIGPDAEEFSKQSVTDFNEYCQLFEGVQDEIAIGEASPLYLYSMQAPERIKHYVPNIKLIAILRNPVQRAYSSYMHYVREAYETMSFAEALDAEETRIQENWVYMWHYKRCGHYYQQLMRYFDIFDSNQIKIYLYDDLVADPIALLRDMFQYLGVDDNFVPDLTVLNASGIPKNRLLYNLLDKRNPVRSALKFLPKDLRRNVAQPFRQWNLGKKPKLAPEIKQNLIETYREEILQLENLLQRDLSAWLQ